LLGALVCLMGIPTSHAAPSKKPKSKRTVWLGVVRGPLAPKAARAIEIRVREALITYPSVHVIDAAGHALEERPLAVGAAAMAKLLDEGIEHLLGLRYDDAIDRLESATSLFEGRLTMLKDHELLHEALLAKAEAQAQSGRKQLAKTTLQRFAALNPTKVPTRDSHKRSFVSLWRDALREIGHSGTLEIRARPAGAYIQVDGVVLGKAPVTTRPMRPGPHYVVARWPSFAVTRTVQLGAGSTVEMTLEQSGPAARERERVRGAIGRRRGTVVAQTAAKKIFQIAHADALFVAGVRRDGDGNALFLARHAPDGSIVGIGRAPLTDEPASAVRKLAAAFLVDGRTGDFQLDAAGTIKDASELADALYGRARADADIDMEDVPDDVASLPEGDDPAPLSALTPGAEVTAAAPITEKWWFWTLIGVVAVGGAATAYALVPRRADSTNIQITLPPR